MICSSMYIPYMISTERMESTGVNKYNVDLSFLSLASVLSLVRSTERMKSRGMNI